MEPDLDELRRARMRRLDPTNNSAAPPPPPPPAEDAVSRDDPPSQQTTISTLLPSFGGQTPVVFCVTFEALASFFRQHQTGNALQTAHPSPSSVTVTEIAPEPAEPKVASHSEEIPRSASPEVVIVSTPPRDVRPLSPDLFSPIPSTSRGGGGAGRRTPSPEVFRSSTQRRPKSPEQAIWGSTSSFGTRGATQGSTAAPRRTPSPEVFRSSSSTQRRQRSPQQAAWSTASSSGTRDATQGSTAAPRRTPSPEAFMSSSQRRPRTSFLNDMWGSPSSQHDSRTESSERTSRWSSSSGTRASRSTLEEEGDDCDDFSFLPSTSTQRTTRQGNKKKETAKRPRGRPPKNKSENEKQFVLCAICRVYHESRFVSTSCGHVFHEVCLNKWASTSGQVHRVYKVCPVCGQDYDHDTINTLFF